MKLYKYRSLDNMDYVFDILSNGLVYCSSYKDLNDPFEGQFRKLYSKSQFGTQQYGDIQFGSSILKRKSLDDNNEFNKNRVCSFSKTKTDVRLWSYYADSHKGICIEFDIDYINVPNFYQVVYDLDEKRIKSNVIDDKIAINILRRKTKHWIYEKEVRLITEESKYCLKKHISSVILGCRISDLNEGIIKAIKGSIPVKYAILTDDLKINVVSNK